MKQPQTVSSKTLANWWIDAVLFVSALLAALSGLYFLFLPSGGYRGGRNPWYGVTILFDRHTWSDLHVWGGLAMIAAVAIHLVWHWNWITLMARRCWAALRAQGTAVSAGAKVNIVVDSLIALGFVVTAVSGLYFFFFAGEGNAAAPVLLFDRTTWDLLHTWGFVLLVGAAMTHIYIHWRWVSNVTGRVLGSLWPSRPAVLPHPEAKSQV